MGGVVLSTLCTCRGHFQAPRPEQSDAWTAREQKTSLRHSQVSLSRQVPSFYRVRNAPESMTPTQAVPASPVIHNYSLDQRPPIPHRPFTDPHHLAPEDAFFAHSPPRRQQPVEQFSELDGDAVTTSIPSLRGGATSRKKGGRDRHRSGSRRGRKAWKKLLWVKQKHCTSGL